MGLEIVSVRVSTVQPDRRDGEGPPDADPRSRSSSRADQATFARRGLAVEKERAIAENELQNRIELARRQASWWTRRAPTPGARRRKPPPPQDRGRSGRRTGGHRDAAKAGAVKAVEGERLAIEKERVAAYGALPPAALAALAAREFAGRIEKIEHVNISPDALTPFLSDLARPARAD